MLILISCISLYLILVLYILNYSKYFYFPASSLKTQYCNWTSVWLAIWPLFELRNLQHWKETLLLLINHLICGNFIKSSKPFLSWLFSPLLLPFCCYLLYNAYTLRTYKNHSTINKLYLYCYFWKGVARRIFYLQNSWIQNSWIQNGWIQNGWIHKRSAII